MCNTTYKFNIKCIKQAKKKIVTNRRLKSSSLLAHSNPTKIFVFALTCSFSPSPANTHTPSLPLFPFLSLSCLQRSHLPSLTHSLNLHTHTSPPSGVRVCKRAQNAAEHVTAGCSSPVPLSPPLHFRCVHTCTHTHTYMHTHAHNRWLHAIDTPAMDYLTPFPLPRSELACADVAQRLTGLEGHVIAQRTAPTDSKCRGISLTTGCRGHLPRATRRYRPAAGCSRLRAAIPELVMPRPGGRTGRTRRTMMMTQHPHLL